jgi:hypothetical protein
MSVPGCLHYEFNNLTHRHRISVSLSDQTVVRLMDDAQWSAYQTAVATRMTTFGYIGGLAVKTPVVFRVPHDGAWHVVIDTYPVKEVSVRAIAPTVAKLGQRLGFPMEDATTVDLVIEIPSRMHAGLLLLGKRLKRAPADVIAGLLAITLPRALRLSK